MRGAGGFCSGSAGGSDGIQGRDEEPTEWGSRLSWNVKKYFDDIKIATTAELAPFVMAKLKETLEKHGFELGSDKCTAYCPTPERTDHTDTIRKMDAEWPHDLGKSQRRRVPNQRSRPSSRDVCWCWSFLVLRFQQHVFVQVTEATNLVPLMIEQLGMCHGWFSGTEFAVHHVLVLQTVDSWWPETFSIR